MRRLRIGSQWLFGTLFILLFAATRYTGSDVIPWPVNAFFQVDPLAAATAMAAGRRLLTFFWPLLLVIPVALVFGRTFCGWICPMGGLLDAVGRRSRVRAPKPSGRWYRVKDMLLVVLLASSVLAMNLAGLVDPISLLIRSLAMGVAHPVERAVTTVFDSAYRAGGPVSGVTEPIYGALKATVLSFEVPVFRYGALFLGILALVVALELRERRFWCRNLCPLGALQGWLSSGPPLGLKVQGSACTGCGSCAAVCRMGAIEGGDRPRIRPRDCVLCYDCAANCPEGAIGHWIGQANPKGTNDVTELGRRRFLAGLGVGVLAPLVLGRTASPDALPSSVIRPPGAASEDLFLNQCIRCGECMRVCLTNGLQPTLLEAGFAGLWTPRLLSRVGYCEYSCTLCGQVCPTGAITRLDRVAKQSIHIGTAVINRNTCIPFVRPEQCMVCEEHCPTPRKAIVFDEVEVTDNQGGRSKVLQPRVLRDLCIGCGICENKCPIEGEAAIQVVRDGEQRFTPGGRNAM